MVNPLAIKDQLYNVQQAIIRISGELDNVHMDIFDNIMFGREDTQEQKQTLRQLELELAQFETQENNLKAQIKGAKQVDTTNEPTQDSKPTEDQQQKQATPDMTLKHALELAYTWSKFSKGGYAAKAYLENLNFAMLEYGYDGLYTQLLYIRSNLSSWRDKKGQGDTVKRAKARIDQAIKEMGGKKK